MKILAFVDSHGSEKAFKKIKHKVKKEDPDLIICAGDFTVFERDIVSVIEKFSGLRRRMLITHGNHETESHVRELCEDFDTLLFRHCESYVYEDVLFLFHGGGGFSHRDRGFEKIRKKFEKKMKDFEKVVLVTHAPPYETAIDEIFGDEHCGCKSYKDFVVKHKKKLKLVIAGHIHECAGQEEKMGDCLIINPGPNGKILKL